MKPAKKQPSRRNFLEVSGAGLVGITLAHERRAQPDSRGETPSRRRIFPLNHNWLYNDSPQSNAASGVGQNKTSGRHCSPQRKASDPWFEGS